MLLSLNLCSSELTFICFTSASNKSILFACSLSSSSTFQFVFTPASRHNAASFNGVSACHSTGGGRSFGGYLRLLGVTLVGRRGSSFDGTSLPSNFLPSALTKCQLQILVLPITGRLAHPIHSRNSCFFFKGKLKKDIHALTYSNN